MSVSPVEPYDPEVLRLRAWILTGLALCLFLGGVTFYSLPLAASLAWIMLAGMFATRHVSALMIGTFALMPFQQSLVGEDAPCNLCAADITLSLLLIAVGVRCVQQGRVRLGSMALPLFLFLSVVFTSGLLTYSGGHTLMALARILRGTLAPVLLFANGDTRPETPRRCFLAYLIGINILTLYSLEAFARGGIEASMYTLGIHKNALGPTFGCGIVIGLALLLTEEFSVRPRVWLLLTLLGATMGSLLSLSRGGWLATMAGLGLLLLVTRFWKPMAAGAAILLPMFIALLQLLPRSVAEYAEDLSTGAYNVRLRLDAMSTALQAFQRSPLFGIGIDFAYTLDPHNVYVLTLAETGLVGLGAFLLLGAGGFATCYRAAQNNPNCRSLAIVGAGVLLVTLVDAAFDVYWRRGVGILGWACVGLMIPQGSVSHKKIKETT